MSSAIARAPWLCRWVVAMAVAVGVVGMHHLVGAHAHPGGSGSASAGMTMPVTQIGSCCGTAPVTVTVAARPAQPGAGDGLMLHPCLAVLTGLILLAALVLTRRLAQGPGLGLPGAGLSPRSSQQRAPPLPLRLAQLGVLRL
ncbi:MAG: DUF6153 family protein [Actinobacteria bacterium]|nr:DUF6153 family protein [Actinomycetota bacterium]